MARQNKRDKEKEKKKQKAKQETTEVSTRGEAMKLYTKIAKSGYTEEDNKENGNLFLDNYYKHNPRVDWVSTGMALVDLAISYPLSHEGIPLPAMIELYGDPNVGKSRFAYQIGGNVQRKGGMVILIDNEGHFTHEYGRISGLSLSEDQLQVWHLPILENCLKTMKDLIEVHKKVSPKRILCIILDSVAQTGTMNENEALEKDKHAAQATAARVLRQWLRTHFARLMYGSRILIVMVNHVYSTNQSYGATDTTYGGDGIKIYAKERIRLSRTQALKERESDTQPWGQRTEIKIEKNKIGEGHTVNVDLIYKTGFEDYMPVIAVLKSKRKIQVSGEKPMWKGKVYSFQALRSHFIDNPDEWLEAKLLLVDALGDQWGRVETDTIDYQEGVVHEKRETPQPDSGNKESEAIPGAV